MQMPPLGAHKPFALGHFLNHHSAYLRFRTVWSTIPAKHKNHFSIITIKGISFAQGSVSLFLPQGQTRPLLIRSPEPAAAQLQIRMIAFSVDF